MNKKLWIFLGLVLGVVANCGAMHWSEADEEEFYNEQEARQANPINMEEHEAKDLTYDEAKDKAWVALNTGVNEKFINALHELDRLYNKIHGESQEAKVNTFVEEIDQEGYTPFLRAVKNGDKDIVVTLLGRSGTDAQAKVGGKNALEIIAAELSKNPSEEKKIEYAQIAPLLVRADVPVTESFRIAARKSDVVRNALAKELGFAKSRQILFGGK